MSTDNLSPPGSSEYSSSTMTVGDGTWDSSRNTFLLPNLVGLNFDTMRYNGMGNRFRELPQYHRLILGHGVVAAITFILIVPAAIFIAKYGHGHPRLSLKMHVYLQILTVLLATVVLVLGWFAVGPERALTNPHHGIGVAIYVLVLVQFLWGWLMFKRERKRKVIPTKVPKKVHIHKLFGRSIALLGFVQIALGLTLYGSPKVLFILYALMGALLLFLYLALEYHFKQRVSPAARASRGVHDSDYSESYDGSYVSGSRTDYTQDNRRRPAPEGRESESHWGRKLLAGAGALGAYETWKHKRERKKSGEMDRRDDMDSRYDGTESRLPASTIYGDSSRPPPGASTTMYGESSRPPMGASTMTPVRARSRNRRQASESGLSPQSWEDEKYSEAPRPNTWRNRLLGAGAGIAAFQGVKGLFNRRKRQNDDYVDRESYRPPLGGNQNMVSQTDVSRVRHGDAPFSPGDERRNERVNMATASSMPPDSLAPTSAMTPTRPPRRPRPSTDMYSYDSRDSLDDDLRGGDNRPNTLRDSIATYGALAGFREWNSRRKQRREDQRIDRQRMEEIDNAERFNRRTSMSYPRPQDSNRRRPSVTDTVMTGVTHDPAMGSNPELSRTTLRPNINAPPLPAGAGNMHSPSRQNITETGYVLPPPPPGPPPQSTRPAEYIPPVPGSAHMPLPAVEPDPARLLSHNTLANEASAYGRTVTTDPTIATTGPSTGAATIATSAGPAIPVSAMSSQSPSRYRARSESRSRHPTARRNSQSSVSAIPSPSRSQAPTSPVRVKMNIHNDSGGHVTLARLPDDPSVAPSSNATARRSDRERRRHRRRASSASSGLESDAPPGSNRRYRRNGGVRPSSQQPISNVPPPPAMSNSAVNSGSGTQRPPSELNLPPPPRVPTHGGSPGLSPPTAGMGMGTGSVGSPGAGGYAGGTETGTETGMGTDVSAFADNRRRRRAERARRQQGGGRVEFE